MANLLGNDFKLYRDSASNWSSPTWVELTDIGDLGRDHAAERVEIPKRIAFKVYQSGRKDLTFTWTMNVDPANTHIMAIITAIEDGTKMHFALASGAIAASGTIYWHAFMHLTGPEDFSLDNPATLDVEAKPHAGDTNLPAKVSVA